MSHQILTWRSAPAAGSAQRGKDATFLRRLTGDGLADGPAKARSIEAFFCQSGEPTFFGWEGGAVLRLGTVDTCARLADRKRRRALTSWRLASLPKPQIVISLTMQSIQPSF